MNSPLSILPGRGTAMHPGNRFERIAVEDDFSDLEHDAEFLETAQRPKTHYLLDTSRSIIASNDSPDVGFTHSINPYRGCEHGCIYCYARPSHEYLSFNAGIDFETRILVKANAPLLLRQELMAPRYRPTTLSISGVTDCYQPIERKLQITRRCLEVLAEFRNPFSIITKNHLVTRDIDILGPMARIGAAAVFVSITTLDAELARRMEPRTSAPRRRLEIVQAMADAGIPVGVMVAPVIPGLTDHEMPAILKAAATAGATAAGYVPVRLPFAVKTLFEDWLANHYPDRKEKVLNRIRSMRGGQLNDSQFGSRMRGQGPWADQLASLFELAKRKAGIRGSFPALSADHFRVPGGQMTLW